MYDLNFLSLIPHLMNAIWLFLFLCFIIQVFMNHAFNITLSESPRDDQILPSGPFYVLVEGG